MAGFRIEGNTSGNVAEVDASNQLKVANPTNIALAGYNWMASLNDAGTITGNIEAKAPRTSDDYRLSVGMDTPLFEESFNATVQNTHNWQFFSLNSLIASQSGGYLNMNPTQVVTSGGVVSMTSKKHFTMMTNGTMHVEFAGAFSGVTNTPLANQVIEFGVFISPTTAVAPPDGVFFRYTSAGLNGVMVNNGGSETTIPTPRTCNNFGLDVNYDFKMIIGESFVDFYVNNVEIGSFNVPPGFGTPFLSGALPIGIIQRNTGLITSVNGTYLRISGIHADAIDLSLGKTHADIMCGMGRHGAIVQNGATVTSTSNLTNSLAIGTAAALSNTTIAAPACIGLGGQATYLPTLAVFTDGILQSYLNPVGSVNIQPRNLVIKGVRIASAVSSALTGGALALQYSLAYGHSAVSLATAEATTFTTGGGTSAIRVPLGVEGFAAAAAIGVTAQSGVNVKFDCPIVVYPGQYVALAVKNVGVVTTAGSVTSYIGFDAYWE